MIVTARGLLKSCLVVFCFLVVVSIACVYWLAGVLERQAVERVAFSGVGTHLLAGSHAGSVELWDVQARKVLWRKWLEGAITVVAFSPQGETFVAGSSEGGTVILGDVQSGALLTSLKGKYYLDAACFSPDGRELYTVGKSEIAGQTALFRRWDVQTGAALPGEAKEVSYAKQILASANNERVFVVSKFSLGIWKGSPPVYEGTAPLRETSISCGALSADGHYVAVGGNSGHVAIYDTATWRVYGEWRTGQADVQSIAFSPDGRFLATACGGHVSCFDLQNTAQQNVFFRYEETSIKGVAFLGDGRVACFIYVGRGTPNRIEFFRPQAFSQRGKTIKAAAPRMRQDGITD